MRFFYALMLSALRSAASFSSGVLTAQRVAFGLSTTQTIALDAAVINFDSAVDDVTAAHASLRAAVEAQDAAKQALFDALTSCASTIYANTAVTDSMLASAGFPARDTARTKQSPFTPTDLIVTPYANGSANLKWKPGQNTYGAIYVIEARFGEGDWTVVYQTTKSKATLSGFEPGQIVWFRVLATRNEETSAPTEQVVIYAPTPGASSLMEAA